MKSRGSLHVLLTNDDGHRAPGLTTLRRVMQAQGFRTSVVAPSSEQSATGTSTTTRRELALEAFDDNCWHLDAQPADAVLVATRHILYDDPPDLVVSGVNFGPNLGIGLHASGTVGAAVMASLSGYPAIAISAGMLFQESTVEPTRYPSTHKALEDAAEFTCTVIDSLRASPHRSGRLLPSGLLLNINYPALSRAAIRGVEYPEVSYGHIIELTYHRDAETGRVIPRYHPGVDPDQPEEEEGDVRAHLEGFITISPVRPVWNAPAQEIAELRDRLGDYERFLTAGGR